MTERVVKIPRDAESLGDTAVFGKQGARGHQLGVGASELLTRRALAYRQSSRCHREDLESEIRAAGSKRRYPAVAPPERDDDHRRLHGHPRGRRGRRKEAWQ